MPSQSQTKPARKWLFLFSGVLAFAVGGFAFYYGAVMAFFVPGYRGESYFQKDRVLLGILPFLLGIGILSLAGWLFSKLAPNPTPEGAAKAIGYCFAAVFAILLLLAMVGSYLYQR
jgi:hypothetical protein